MSGEARFGATGSEAPSSAVITLESGEQHTIKIGECWKIKLTPSQYVQKPSFHPYRIDTFKYGSVQGVSKLIELGATYLSPHDGAHSGQRLEVDRIVALKPMNKCPVELT